jgi:hypothetical protein
MLDNEIEMEIQEIEEELEIDLDEYDYYASGVMQRW